MVRLLEFNSSSAKNRKETLTMAAKSMLPAISPDGNLSRYLDQIRAFPMLEQGEEYMLA